MDAEDLVDCTQRCPICHATGGREIVGVIQRQPDVTLLECPRCHGCSASHMPAPGLLRRYYATYHGERAEKVTFAGKARFAAHVVCDLPRESIRPRMRILDFGGGDGTLSIAIAELLLRENVGQCEITVIDSATPATPQDSRINVESCSTTDEASPAYDLVLASAVLEHVPDLHDLLPKLFGRIAPAGSLYARTPFIAPLQKLVRADFGYPAHVHDLGNLFWAGISELVDVAVRTLVSRPSLVAASWRTDPMRALLSHALKVPARIECMLFSKPAHRPLWPFVGGWEVVLQRSS